MFLPFLAPLRLKHVIVVKKYGRVNFYLGDGVIGGHKKTFKVQGQWLLGGKTEVSLSTSHSQYCNIQAAALLQTAVLT